MLGKVKVMSYSYIKSVFPNFTSKLYDERIYSSLDSLNAETTKLITGTSPKSSQMPVQTLPVPLDTETQPFLTLSTAQPTTLSPPTVHSEVTQIDSTPKVIENFEEPKKEPTHEQVLTHLENCESCKSKFTNNNNNNEDIMELISYIALGIFILLVLDRKKQT